MVIYFKVNYFCFKVNKLKLLVNYFFLNGRNFVTFPTSYFLYL